MLKPILLAGAMLLAGPSLAQVNASSGSAPKDENVSTAGHPDAARPEPTMGGSEGTTASHAISSATDGVEETDAEPAMPAGTEATITDRNQAYTGAVGMIDRTDAGPAGTGTSHATAHGQAQAGATGATAGTSGQTSSGFAGIGGPNGDLMEVAGEVLGDPARVENIMRGRDRSMKASDLLNAAMLTLIQSGGNQAPR